MKYPKILLTMIEFIEWIQAQPELKEWFKSTSLYQSYLWHCTTRYADFLSTKIEPYRLAPLDSYGKLIKEPIQIGSGNEQYEGAAMDEYRQALDKVWFFNRDLKKPLISNLIDEIELSAILPKDMRLHPYGVLCGFICSSDIYKSILVL